MRVFKYIITIPAVVLFLGTTSCKEKQQTAPLQGIATFIKGEVTLTSGDTPPVTLSPGAKVSEGETIQTGKSSTAVIQLNAVGTIRVAQNSQVVIEAVKGDGETMIELKDGVIMGEIIKRKEGASFSIRAIETVAAVRGTRLLVKAEGKKKKVVVAVSEGLVDVTLGKKTQKVQAQKAVVIKTAKKKFKVRPIHKIEKKELQFFDNLPYDESLNSLPDEERKKKLQQISENINKLLDELKQGKKTQTPKTLEEIKAKYGKIDQIEMYSGKVVKGAIIKRTATVYTVVTTKGVVTLQKNKIKKASVIK